MNDVTSREVQIGPWLSQVFTHFSAHWQKYMVPALAFAGVIIVLTVVVGGMMLAGVILGEAVNEELVTFALFGGATLVGGGVALLTLPLFVVGFLRGILAVNRGEEFQLSIITGAVRELPTILGIMLLTGLAVWIGMMLCVIPGLVLGIGLQFALTIYADRKLGVVECLQESWELAKSNLLMLFVYFFVAGLIVGVIQYIPIVGMLVAMPLHMMMNIAAYLGLTGQGELRA